MFPIHRNNDRVPYLRNQDLGLVLHLHLGCRKQLGIYPLWKACVNVLPRCPDRQAESKGATNAEDDDPDDVPEICVEEEEDEVHDIHDSQRERDMVRTEFISKQSIVASLDLHAGHYRNGATERGRQEKVGFDEFTAKDEEPEHDGCRARRAGEGGIGSSKCLGSHVLSGFASYPIAKHPSRGNDSKGEGDDYRDEKLDHTDDEWYHGSRACRQIVHHRYVNGRTGRQGEYDDQKHESGSEM